MEICGPNFHQFFRDLHISHPSDPMNMDLLRVMWRKAFDIFYSLFPYLRDPPHKILALVPTQKSSMLSNHFIHFPWYALVLLEIVGMVPPRPPVVVLNLNSSARWSLGMMLGEDCRRKPSQWVWIQVLEMNINQRNFLTCRYPISDNVIF